MTMPTKEELKNMKCRGSKVEKLPSSHTSRMLRRLQMARLFKYGIFGDRRRFREMLKEPYDPTSLREDYYFTKPNWIYTDISVMLRNVRRAQLRKIDIAKIIRDEIDDEIIKDLRRLAESVEADDKRNNEND